MSLALGALARRVGFRRAPMQSGGICKMLALYLVIVIAALALLGAAPLPMSIAAALGALVAMLLVVEVRRRLWVAARSR